MAQAHAITEPPKVSCRLNTEAEREWPDRCVAVRIPMGFKVTLIVGECATPYAGGVFHMTITVSEEYPFRPPTMTFTSVNGGRDRWNPGMSIAVVSNCC
jgi:ubiquitin-protein ligase